MDADARESARNDDAVRAFHRLFYDTQDTTWKQTFWLGVTVRKCAFDLWTYQEILVETHPDLIVETGTYLGGSAFYMASVCDLLGHGKVVTVDISAPAGRPRHRRITYLQGSSTDPGIVERIARRAQRAERVMVVLDSNHSRDHVLRELEVYGPLVTPGCYLVVEDTNVNGHPVLPDHGPGPMEAIEEFIATTDDFEVDRSRENRLLTFNPSGYLRRR
jgi:cephalosporin hydroxylase